MYQGYDTLLRNMCVYSTCGMLVCQSLMYKYLDYCTHLDAKYATSKTARNDRIVTSILEGLFIVHKHIVLILS